MLVWIAKRSYRSHPADWTIEVYISGQGAGTAVTQQAATAIRFREAGAGDRSSGKEADEEPEQGRHQDDIRLLQLFEIQQGRHRACRDQDGRQVDEGA